MLRTIALYGQAFNQEKLIGRQKMKFKVSPTVGHCHSPYHNPSPYHLFFGSQVPRDIMFTMGLYHIILVWKRIIILIICIYYAPDTALHALDNNPIHDLEKNRALKCLVYYDHRGLLRMEPRFEPRPYGFRVYTFSYPNIIVSRILHL